MRKATPVKSATIISFLFHRNQTIHTSPIVFQWKLRDESNLGRSELVDRICRLLILRRFNAVAKLSFHFSDDLVDSVLRELRLNPNACLEFFKLASKQQTFRPHIKSYCKIVHVLSRGRMFDETRSYLNELVEFCKTKKSSIVIWDELVRVYREFSFSPTVFDMILKVYAKKGLTEHALYVFDNMDIHARPHPLKTTAIKIWLYSCWISCYLPCQEREKLSFDVAIEHSYTGECYIICKC